jgi:8-oxo-dGTP diphosphatase
MSLPMKSGRDGIGDDLPAPPGAVNHRRASPLDRLYQTAIAVTYRLLLAWWFIRRPRHRGALVALWHDGEILLLRSSYRAGWGLPGGGVGRCEDARDAARRELREEIGFVVDAAALREAQVLDLVWEYRRDHTTIFELTLPARPTLHLDQREIVGAAFHAPGAVPADAVAPHVARYLARYRAG